MKLFRNGIILFIVFSTITGVIYPLLITGIGRLAFPYQAEGSLLAQKNIIIGSKLIGQHVTDAKYFWSRPSATRGYPYNALASSGSNLGPLNPTLIKLIKDRIMILQQYPHPPGFVPVDLVTASASGLDSEISPAAALYQIPRVAQMRVLEEEKIRQLVNKHIQPRQFGLLGEPRVNVLQLNLALDQMKNKGS